ncbi:MAG: glycoside hydrolase family 28 protein [Bacteroidales bacterium]|nr:glycoside hydrolase family 28 protein [Bacteroidales bacterium]MBN2817522.1 glycoside hydrolase family 28 protein [Bacteroidales bacterium]
MTVFKNIFYISLLLGGLVNNACNGVGSGNTEKKDVNVSYSLLESPWEYAKGILDSIPEPLFKDADYNITDFGAINDGVTDCSKAINDAIKKCSEEGGGRVIVPEGTFLTGAVHLKNNVNLHISEKAELLFTKDKSKYLPAVHTRFEGMELMNYSPLIYAYKQKNIAITGKGVINGQGEVWWNWKGKWSGSVEHSYDAAGRNTQQSDIGVLYKMVEENVPLENRVFGEGHYLRPSFVQPYLCENVLIEGIKVIGSPMWIIHPVLSKNIIVRKLHIESLGPNNDGCDPECCENVLIEDCYFNTGDDCIAIKSGRNNDGRRIGVPSKNIYVRNCTMVEGHGGVVMGSEISGNISYVFAENCVMDSPNLERAIRIKSNSFRGGIVEHVYVRDIEVKQVKEAVLKINMYYSNEEGENLPIARNIVLERVNAYKSEYPVWIESYKQEPATNIILKNCDLKNIEKPNHIINAENIRFEDVKINGKVIKDL